MQYLFDRRSFDNSQYWAILVDTLRVLIPSRNGVTFNTVKNTDDPLSIKLMRRCCFEVIYCSVHPQRRHVTLGEIT